MQNYRGTVESRRSAILSTLFGIAMKYIRPFCYPAQVTILALLSKYHGINISRRTLNRDLARLVKDGFIDRMRRLTRKGIMAGRFASTLYTLKRKAFKYVYGLKKWGDRVFSVFRVPRMAHNKSQRENEILKQLTPNVEMLWKSPIKGKSSPVYLDG
jgi:DNA-binding HxlR family transcriptional regulator